MSFLTVSMIDLERKMQADGLVEVYQNGEHQTGVKVSAAAQTYNNFLKSYAQLHAKLLQIAPHTEDTVQETDPVEEDPEEETTAEECRLATLKDLLRYGSINQEKFDKYIAEENLAYLMKGEAING